MSYIYTSQMPINFYSNLCVLKIMHLKVESRIHTTRWHIIFPIVKSVNKNLNLQFYFNKLSR